MNAARTIDTSRDHRDVVAWHACRPDEVLARLETRASGLTEEEARRRLAQWGENRLHRAAPRSSWQILGDQLRSVVTLLLVAAALVAGSMREWPDALAIGAVLALNVAIGFTTERRARRAMDALLHLDVPRAIVIREGRRAEVNAATLVRGDVVELEAGQHVPADARLLHGAALRVTESALTGEFAPVDKLPRATLEADTPLPDRATMLYMGTAIVAGHARAVVVATAMRTEVGRIGTLVAAQPESRTPLERQLDVLGRRLMLVAVGVAAGVALLAWSRGAPIGSLLQLGIATAVAAVPEGLPAVITIAMAVGVRRMARRNALVRRLPAVETLGATTIVCTDKTGTLTAGEMTVVRLWIDEVAVNVSGEGYAPRGAFVAADVTALDASGGPLGAALRIGALVNRGDVHEDRGTWVAIGDPTEAALVVAARKAGIDVQALRAASSEIAEEPFSSETRLMATVYAAPAPPWLGMAASAEHPWRAVKGAPEQMLGLCSRQLTADGERPLDDAGRAELLRRNEHFAHDGMRVLALAAGRADPRAPLAPGLTFVALVGLFDPPASEVATTIARLHEAGIRVLVVTGDQRATAAALARDVGIARGQSETIDAPQIAALDDAALAARLRGVHVVSRVSPEDKLRIVRALQADGEVVAMLGDGVNDAAALRRADVGVAMGRRGTDVAREAAAVVLGDDRLETVAAAVEEGRVVYANIRRFVLYLFSCNLAEIGVLVGAGVAGLPNPLLPLQILWLNIVTDGVPALALAMEPAERDVMRARPRPPSEALASARLARHVAAYAALITLASLLALVIVLRRNGSETTAATAAFMTLGLAQIFHLGNARSTSHVLSPRAATANRHALAGALLAVAMQLLPIWIPAFGRLLGVTTLGAGDWAVVALLAGAPAVLVQTTRLVRRR